MSYVAHSHTRRAHGTLSTNTFSTRWQLWQHYIMHNEKERMMKRYTYFSIYYLNLMDVDLHLCGTDVLYVYAWCTCDSDCYWVNAMWCVCMKWAVLCWKWKKTHSNDWPWRKISVFLDVCGLPAWWKYNLWDRQPIVDSLFVGMCCCNITSDVFSDHLHLTISYLHFSLFTDHK